MSKFFRSGDSSSSSASDDPSTDEDDTNGSELNDRLSHDHASPPDRADHRSLVINEAAPSFEQAPRDFLLHALLEERCLNQVRESHLGSRFGKNSPEVMAAARSNYLRLCSQLSPLNLITSGPEHDQHDETRRRFRDGLELLGRQGSAQSAVPLSMRRLLTDTNAVTETVSQQQSLYQLTQSSQIPGALQKLLHRSHAESDAVQSLHSWHPALSIGSLSGLQQTAAANAIFEKRYYRDFEELNVLGRGGFGVVYHVRHRLDRQAYAVKKIPLSRSRIQRIQSRGQSELDEFLLELQTLARLEHPNIVRYYGGWIEWVDATSASSFDSSSSDIQAAAGAEPDSRFLLQDSISHILSSNSADLPDVVFEDSGPIPKGFTSNRQEISDRRDNRLQRVATKSTIATVSDDTIESIDRPDEPSMSIVSAADGAHFAEPTLALHVQMSLHPMTLADFLSPPLSASGDSPQPLSHCFHLAPSVDIVLAILDGIEYLHNEGIVHRDIKPANIFLGASTTARSVRGSVDLATCPNCHAEGNSSPVSIHVRIGDFGLVTALAKDSPPFAESSAIGTEIYRPLSAMSNASPELDIYALGIITFELLHKFDTRMERHDIIQQLKQGSYPDSFADRLGKVGAKKAKGCIDAMLSSVTEAMSMKELRRKLEASRT